MAFLDDVYPGFRSRWWAWTRLCILVLAPVVASVLLYLSRQRLPWMVLSAYGVVSIGRVLLQSITSAIVRHRKLVPTERPMVSVVVAVRNERPDLFEQAMRSLAEQKWPHYEVIVIDDGSADPDDNRVICEELGFRYVFQENAGKRHALYRAFGMLDPASVYVLTSDSDTVWAPEAISDLVASMQADDTVGAVTGHVGTLNASDNWLTRLTSKRYWLAFEVERASQGFFGTVTCVSGPLGGYRRDVIERIKEPFISQRFLGRVCTFGDDRHLTNLVLALGFQVVYSRATAWTEVPVSLHAYLRQQLRWSRSFWRESLWTARALPKQRAWLTLDYVLTVLMPLQLAVTVCWFIWMGTAIHVSYLLMFALIVMGMSLIRIAPAIIATRRIDFLSLLAFGLFYLALLLPLRFIALVTPTVGTWGSRGSAQLAAAIPAQPAGAELQDAELANAAAEPDLVTTPAGALLTTEASAAPALAGHLTSAHHLLPHQSPEHHAPENHAPEPHAPDSRTRHGGHPPAQPIRETTSRSLARSRRRRS